jgi:Leucine-rich repeat (LRR) protein
MTCSNLNSLYLNNCSLAHFPPQVSSLTGLSVLALSDNGIAAISGTQIAVLERLNELDIRNNALTALPPELGLLPLRSLQIEGNILRSLRRSVIEGGTAAVLAYLRDRLPA